MATASSSQLRRTSNILPSSCGSRASVRTTHMSSFGEEQRRKLARKDYPSLEARRQRSAGTEEVVIDLPEFDLRRAAAAQDPLAVVEGFRVNIFLRLASHHWRSGTPVRKASSAFAARRTHPQCCSAAMLKVGDGTSEAMPSRTTPKKHRAAHGRVLR